MANTKNMKKEKIFETILTLVTALIILSLIFKTKHLLSMAWILGLVGLFIKPLAEFISKMWLKLSEIMGSISSKIILSLVFFLFLVPIAFIYRLFNKDSLLIKNTKRSLFFNRDHKYTKEDFENSW